MYGTYLSPRCITVDECSTELKFNPLWHFHEVGDSQLVLRLFRDPYVFVSSNVFLLASRTYHTSPINPMYIGLS